MLALKSPWNKLRFWQSASAEMVTLLHYAYYIFRYLKCMYMYMWLIPSLDWALDRDLQKKFFSSFPRDSSDEQKNRFGVTKNSAAITRNEFQTHPVLYNIYVICISTRHNSKADWHWAFNPKPIFFAPLFHRLIPIIKKFTIDTNYTFCDLPSAKDSIFWVKSLGDQRAGNPCSRSFNQITGWRRKNVCEFWVFPPIDVHDFVLLNGQKQPFDVSASEMTQKRIPREKGKSSDLHSHPQNRG